jgi:hypothetical protein
MATVTNTTLVDDMDATPDGVATVTFSVDNYKYEIDLTGANREKLYNALEPFMEAGRQIRQDTAKAKAPRNGRQPARTDPEQLAAIRTWAREAGHAVSPRGRIAQAIQDAYNQAHQEATA